jgi:anaerobic selenocysteine-containing dehydrogenase
MYEDKQPGTAVDPLPVHIPPHDSPATNADQAKKYPLNILSPKPHAFLNTQYGNEPVQQHSQGEQLVLIHPDDAGARRITSGSYVRVFNDVGSFEGRAEVSDDVMPGLVLANVGHWPGLNRSGAVNTITARRHSCFGQAGTYSDNLVEVVPV